ncbi:MAG: DUF3305 domain-containing protein [Betaproteobacteria bacterium]|nr:DUF3305 domain-containing protein [Betaproteobacteria bacterium]
MQRTPLANRWAAERWEPVAVAVEPQSDNHGHAFFLQADSDAGTRWCFTGFALELHRSEADGYHLNLTAPAPMVFIMWRMLEPESMEAGGPAARPELATVSYNEAARMLDGGEQVDGLPMPAVIREWMTPFVAEHYKPEPKRKVRRRDPLRDEAPPDPALRPSTNTDEPQRE